MKEKPILFKAEMVRAILAGTKTQTRRLVSWPIYPNGTSYDRELGEILCHCDYLPPSAMLMQVRRGKTSYVISNLEAWEYECPHGQPGDRLWVKENYRLRADQDAKKPSEDWWKSGAWYAADGSAPTGCGGGPGRLRPSASMPRWASRITLEITDVRVERLQDISEADARAEGVSGEEWSRVEALGISPRAEFAELWDKNNAKRAPWSSNPWLWVISFRRVTT